MLKKKDFLERVAARMEYIQLHGVYNNLGEPIKKARSSARLVRQTLQAAFEVIQRDLLAEQKILVGDIAIVTLSNRKARIGRNPRTGEPVQIPAKTSMKAKVSRKLKRSILPQSSKKKVAPVAVASPTPTPEPTTPTAA